MPRSRRPGELAALAALGLCLAAFWAGRSWAQHVTPYLGIACFLAAICCAALRLWVGATACLAAAGAALATVIPAYLPRYSAPRPGCTITVVEFNKQAEHPDDAGAARLLARLHPDVIFAEKVYDPGRFRDSLQAAGFAGYYGLPSASNPYLILSRYPFRRTIDDPTGFGADIAVEGRAVRLQNMYTTRPNADWRRYIADMASIRDRARTIDRPLILAGDANATPFTPEIGALREVVRDVWDEAGYGIGATFPGPSRRAGMLGPWLRIDYVFHNAAFDPVSARRIDDATGAGHYPLRVELALVGAGNPGRPCR